MVTRTDFYLGAGPRAEWIGSLQFACHPDNLLKDHHGHAALTAPALARYRDAIRDLLTRWPIERLGVGHPPRHGWPWDWDTSHCNDWIITFLSGPGGGVHKPAGGGTCWHRLDPDDPRPPLRCGPPDLAAWARDPAAPPAVTLPMFRAPGDPPTDYAHLLWHQP
ncbi:hypothetical protein ACFWQL_22350 [Amycolatopsis thermoflava]|uniref:hypothetical protein n=1 Tax=Amycolatopsis thermoflava TaxID=84480 RepID=UPI00364E89FF